MTREDAITILDCERPYGNCGCGATDEEIEEALDMAIKALEQNPCEPVRNPDQLDCINRQAVLKIIDGWYEQNRDTDNIEDLIVLITYMDSVNPQKPNINEVLDKIRAEIDEQYDRVHPYDISCAEGLEMALNIVDKYIAEEDKA